MQPYLTFNGQSAEALAFYAQCLQGKVIFSTTYGEGPMASDVPPEFSGRILHARLEARGHVIMASDSPPQQAFGGHQGFSLSVQCHSVEDAKQTFEALRAGGQVTMPFGPTFWALGFGMLIDKFGVPWMVNCEQPCGDRTSLL